jgi:hypothetical protein
VSLTPENRLLRVSLRPVIKIDSLISPRIFEKNQNGPNGILRGPGDTDSWKNPEGENLVSDSLKPYLGTVTVGPCRTADITVIRVYRPIHGWSMEVGPLRTCRIESILFTWRRILCDWAGLRKIVFTVRLVPRDCKIENTVSLILLLSPIFSGGCSLENMSVSNICFYEAVLTIRVHW